MKKPMPLFVPVLWFGTAAIWCAIVALGLLWGTTPTGLLLLQGLCMGASLAAAIVNLLRYRREREAGKA